jgi:TetR/AcrR family transcriptional regulator
MARSRRAQRPRDADATRRTLLDAATSVFADHGFAGARVDEIAARAGVNKRMIYAYYGDKGGLYREVLSSRLASPEASRALAQWADPRRALEELVRWYFRLLSEDRAFARLLAWELLSGRQRGRDILLDSAAPALELVAGLVRRGVATGALPAGLEPELFRSAVIALGVGYALQHPAMEAARARRGAGSFSDDAFVDYACRLLLGGAGARSG